MKKTKLFTPALISAAVIFAGSIAVYVFSRMFTVFAEWWVKYPSYIVRATLAAITNILPFSLAELIFLLIIPAAIIYISISHKYIVSEQKEKYYKCLRPLLLVLLFLGASFFGVFGPCYFRKGLDESLSLTKAPVTADELLYTAEYLVKEIEQLDISPSHDGAAYYTGGYQSLVADVKKSFKDYCRENKHIAWFDTNPKLIALSPVMTYTHVSGVYSFFTGEANINFNYPQYILPFTLAHEMSHQMGIAREDEANFTAFLVCLNSENAYVRYSGLLNVLEYVMAALNTADKAIYTDFVKNTLTAEIISELRAFNAFFEKYSNSAASQVTGSINNSYLQSQGQQAGSKSYGLVVDLAVAYCKEKLDK